MLDVKLDAPGLLRVESLRITLTFNRTSPTTGRISWNIPTPAAGCTADNQAYCGMIVTVRTKELPIPRPEDHVKYSYDNTVSGTLFAGDRIGDSMVVAALYHDRVTTFVDIEDIDPNLDYFISGFPVDCETRYFRPGVHAYSESGKHDTNKGQNGQQLVQINPPNGPGAEDDDLTGLVVGIDYSFLMQVGRDPVLPMGIRVNKLECGESKPQVVKVNIKGDTALTYKDLINSLNLEFSRLQGSYINNTPINDGQLYWDGSTLYKWDGYNLVDQNAIISDTDPRSVTEGDIRLVLGVLYIYTNNEWSPLVHVQGLVDPTNPKLAQVWFNGNLDQPEANRWSGLTWCEADIVVSTTDPKETFNFPTGTFWFNGKSSLYQWNPENKTWFNVHNIIQSSINPNNATEYLWKYAGEFYTYDIQTQQWNKVKVITSKNTPRETEDNQAISFWFNPKKQEIKRRSVIDQIWDDFTYIEFDRDPLQRSSCELWWDLSHDSIFQWNHVSGEWVKANQFWEQPDDPFQSEYEGDIGLLWFNPDTKEMSEWTTGQCWVNVEYYMWPTRDVAIGTYWFNGTELRILTISGWNLVNFETSDVFPNTIQIGRYWVNPTLPMTMGSVTLWDGQQWLPMWYTEHSPKPKVGSLWTNPITYVTYEWDGQDWVLAYPRVQAKIDCNGNIVIEDSSGGSMSMIEIQQDDEDLWRHLEPNNKIHPAQFGEDPISDQSSYKEDGVGTDGSDALRNQLMNDIRTDLGYPTVSVELTPEQLDLCVTKTIEFIRQRSSASYKRSFFMISIGNETQRYLLTDRAMGHHKIVQVTKASRVTNAFLSTAHGAGVYGQIILQQLYNMGTFDLTSYHLMGNYTSTMEMLFATRLSYNFNEYTREIWFHNRFPYNERKVLLDCVVEKTEQEIIQDRYLLPTIRLMASAHARMMLAEIRGKFSTLPSATGGVSLNASDLATKATADLAKAQEDIEMYVADRVEEFGITDFTWG